MSPASTLAVGIDLVRVSRIAESLERFGERFLRRVFTDDEIAYAVNAPALTAERLAGRFAVKEAAMKALGMTGHAAWRDFEVCRAPDGHCDLVLHGEAKRAALRSGIGDLAMSLSHEGDYATAVVMTCTGAN